MKEYQATQDMIRHYDDLTMRFGTMTQGGVLIFIGLAFGLLTKDRPTFIYLFPFVILFVSICNALVHMWFKRHRSISQEKIHRILEIEKELGWKQFLMVDEAIKSGKIESAPIRKVLVIYHLGLPAILVAAYFVIVFCGRS
jgi:UDP-N-acetylmuramyl pentapeptide phosphotransferase/UDP-N-acetylglucosamine-1-phosphate transferase